MDILLRELAENAGVKSILKKESVLGNLSLSEEALLIASAYRMQPQSMFIVKTMHILHRNYTIVYLLY